MYTKKYEDFLDSIYKPSEYYSKVFFYHWYKACGAFLSEQGLEEEEVIAFMREHPIQIGRAWKYCPDLKPEIFAARHWTRFTVPTTEEEAFKMLDEVVPLEQKDLAIQGTKEEFITEEHFELGMWIRNRWIYRIDCDDSIVQDRYDKCYEMLSGDKPGEMKFEHPDSVSSGFLSRYYDHLKEIVRINAPAIYVKRKPVRCPNCGSKVLRIQYGYPGHEMRDAAERGEILLGGCCISPDSPDYGCPNCGQGYIKGIIDQ